MVTDYVGPVSSHTTPLSGSLPIMCKVLVFSIPLILLEHTVKKLSRPAFSGVLCMKCVTEQVWNLSLNDSSYCIAGNSQRCKILV